MALLSTPQGQSTLRPHTDCFALGRLSFLQKKTKSVGLNRGVVLIDCVISITNAINSQPKRQRSNSLKHDHGQ